MVAPRRIRDNNKSSDSTKAKLFLLVACFWPLWIFALFASSSTNQDLSNNNINNGSTMVAGSKARLNLRNVLDRVDIMGYGPTHPRVAVIIVAEERDSIVNAVKSVFQNTDLNRIFLICAVYDGHVQDLKLIQELEDIDAGGVPHWHGLRPDIHLPGSSKFSTSKQGKTDEDEDPHGHKIHVIFNEERQGLASSRLDAATFIQILAKKHEAAGLKSPQEDLLLLLLQSDARFKNSKWLDPVTSALIVPPPLFGVDDAGVSMKLANAVSFNVEGTAKRTSIDEKLGPVVNEATAKDINLSSGASYPTPALNGAAIALRLDTFLNLPAQDEALTDAWPANLELSLNLWLCGDGIDILQDVEVTTTFENDEAHGPLEPELAARFAAAWMDSHIAQQFFQAYSKTMTTLEWETLMAKAKESSATFPKGLQEKCRSFSWFVQEIVQFGTFANVLAQIVPGDEERTDSSLNRDRIAKDTSQQQVVNLIEDKQQQKVIQKNRKKPSVPLCEECLNIVQRAKPVDISYVDMTGGHREHPHKGARDEEGNWGYIHDETALRKNPPPLHYDEADKDADCKKRDNNWRMLNERVSVDFDYDQQMEQSGVKRDKIFCLVYTIDSGHVKIPNIRETWGPKCDGFMVGSNKTEVAIGAVDIPHEGPEEYNNIWQKVRSMWSYIYDNYYDKYDWFHVGGDDLFLIVENLRLYLESEEIRTASNGGVYLPDGSETTQTPLFLGRRFAYMGDMNDIFNSGGSGYTMNKAALKSLVVEGFPNYFPHAHTFSEDTMVAKVFRKLGVYPYETKDENGSERYMPFLPGHHYGYRLPKGPSNDWYVKYSINIKEGAAHCAPHSVAFHYVKGQMMKRLFVLLYKMCPAI